MLDLLSKQYISIQVIKTLYSRFENFPENSSNNRNAPFHEAFLNAFSDKLAGKVTDIPFFISLSSWLHGLSTTLGQSFFENIAHVLSYGEKKSFTKGAGYSLTVTNNQKEIIGNIITDLKNGNKTPSLTDENYLLFSVNKTENITEANNFTVDVFFESEREIYAIELKTVKPNAGEMRGEKQKILEAKAALMHLYPNKKINYYIGFPFDPTSLESIHSDKSRFLRSIIDGTKYFDPEEVLLADELWNFLSGGTNTMQEIINLINVIATPQFMEIYNFLNESKNRLEDPEKYRTFLQKWNLFNEVELLDLFTNNNISEEKAKRIYWQSIFSAGEYKENRNMSNINKLLA